MHASILLVFTLVQAAPTPAGHSGAPAITVVPSRPSVQKGGVFDIRLNISSDQPLTMITIAPLVPHGFYLEPLPSPHIDIADSGHTVRIGRIAGQSSLAVHYRAWPPSTFGSSHDSGDAGSVSTEEPKVFTFNVFYRLGHDTATQEVSQMVSATVAYTTNLGVYLFSGLIGALLGTLIKTGTRNRAEIKAAVESHLLIAKPFVGGWAAFVANPVGLFTSLLVTFAVLLVMAKNGIPVAGWHQAAALGIGLAVLADDQLLTKLG